MLHLYLCLSFIFLLNSFCIKAAGSEVEMQELSSIEDGKNTEERGFRYETKTLFKSTQSNLIPRTSPRSNHTSPPPPPSNQENYNKTVIGEPSDTDYINIKFREEAVEIGRNIKKWLPLINAMYEASLLKRSSAEERAEDGSLHVGNAVEDIFEAFGQEENYEGQRDFRGFEPPEERREKAFVPPSITPNNKMYLRSIIEGIIIKKREGSDNQIAYTRVSDVFNLEEKQAVEDTTKLIEAFVVTQVLNSRQPQPGDIADILVKINYITIIQATVRGFSILCGCRPETEAKFMKWGTRVGIGCMVSANIAFMLMQTYGQFDEAYGTE